MKVLAVIPSRYDSSRFPGKPLIDLKGKSMIQRVYEACLNCKEFYDVIVATDDERIFKHVEGFGGKAMMTSKNHKSGTDRCAEVLNKYSAGKIDVVLNVQGDEPLVKNEQFNRILSCFKSPDVKIATLGKKGLKKQAANNRNRVKVVCDSNNFALYFSRSPIPHQENTDAEYIKHIGLYAFRSEILKEITQLKPSILEKIESLEQLRWMEAGYKIKVAYTDIETPNIDTTDDVEKVLELL